MKKINFIIMIIMLLNSCFILAQDYTKIGGEDGDFKLTDYENLFFDEQYTKSQYPYALNDPTGLPLVNDLDNDGIKEIIVQADDTIILFHFEDNLVKFVDSKSLDSTTQDGDFYSNMITFDYDADGIDEVIIHQQENQKLYALQYNSSGLYIQQTWNVGGIFTPANLPDRFGDSILGCGHPDGCLLAYNSGNTESGATHRTYLFSFTHSKNEDKLVRDSTAPPDCFSKFGYVAWSEYNQKYYFTTQRRISAPKLYQVGINGSSHLIWDIENLGESYQNVPNACDIRGVKTITSPLVAEFYETKSGEEVGYGFQTSSDKFRLAIYDTIDGLDEIDTYPEFEKTEGVLKSNPFMMDAFGNNKDTDMCVVGYEENDRTIEILCATQDYKSELGFDTPFVDWGLDSVEFTYEMDDEQHNMTSTEIFSVIAHGVNSEGNTDRNEILTSYGIFTLDKYSTTSDGFCVNYGNCDSFLEYEMPVGEEGAYVMDDVQDLNHPDIIGLLDGNLIYLDDGFINRQAYIGYCTDIQPSPLADCWSFGGSVLVTIVPKDYNPEDMVRAKAILYYGEGNASLEESYNYESVDYCNVETGIPLSDCSNTIVFGDGAYRIDENGTATDNRLKIVINFTNSCDSDYQANINNYLEWDSALDDNITFSIYNWDSDTWIPFSEKILSQSGDVWYNYSIPINDSLSEDGFLSDDDIMSFQYEDTSGLNDSIDDRIFLDFIELECITQTMSGGEIDSGWSNWFKADQNPNIPILLTSDLQPLTTLSTIRIMVQDDKHGDEFVYEDYTYSVLDSEVCDDYLDSSFCIGRTEEEYEADEFGTGCETDDDCNSNQVCSSSGICVTIPSSCDSDSDCPDGYFCNGDECEELPTTSENAITESLNTLSFFTKIPALILLLVVYAFLIFEIVKTNSLPSGAKFPAIVILGFVLLLLGVLISVISWVWLLLFIFVILALIGVTFALFLRGR